MKTLYQIVFLVILLNFFTSCTGQTKSPEQSPQRTTTNPNKPVGGGCDGCELMFVGMPAQMTSVDTSAGWQEQGQKLMVTGTVYHRDGKTPAPNVVLYYWQTDNNGYYSPKEGMDAQARRHGHIRGWVKTDAKGQYAIYTIRPAPYPNENLPAHIHLSIKEPNISDEYYIDEFVFDDDKLLTGDKRRKLENRGGSGILRVLSSGALQIAEHNIILGLNIPNYPESSQPEKQSGLQIGEDSPSFIPFHAWGPDKGTRTCPVCKYGRYHGIVYFVGNKPDWPEIKNWLTFLEQESVARSKYLKAYFVYGNENGYNQAKRQAELAAIGRELDLKNLALTFVPSMTDSASEVHLNAINPTVENTFIIFKNCSIVDKYIDLKPTAGNFQMIATSLDQTKGKYFDFPALKHD